MMLDLITIEQAQKTHKVQRHLLQAGVKMKKLTPVHEMPYGMGMMRFYKKSEIEALAKELKDKETETAKTKAVVSTPPTPQLDLSPMYKRLNEIMTSLELLTESMAMVHQQHAILLKSINALEEKLPKAEDQAS